MKVLDSEESSNDDDENTPYAEKSCLFVRT